MPQNLSTPYAGPDRRRRRPERPNYRAPRVLWQGFATGSLLGIGAWAALYVLGGAVAASFYGLAPPGLGSLGPILLGIYGAMSASAALAWGSFTAARTGHASTREEALYYGLGMWSMSTMTLVAVCVYAALGGASFKAWAPLFDVGLRAVGMQAELGMGEHPATVLWAMTATLALSLVLAVRGAQAGVRGPEAV